MIIFTGLPGPKYYYIRSLVGDRNLGIRKSMELELLVAVIYMQECSTEG